MRLKDIKAHARESLKGNWGIAILASFIVGIFCSTGGGVSTSGTEDVDFTKLNQFTNEEIITALAILGGFVLLGMIVSIFISSLVSIGYAQFNVDLVNGNKPRIGTIFSKGKQVGTAIAANFLVFIRIFFGTILFIIPGIIAAYKYSMVNYVIAENPGITAREALQKSKEIMDGHKFRLFRLELSFIGWAFVAVLTLGIAGIWIAPYMQASFAAFYKEIA
jgi:uncharacterized membrane protein